MNLPTPAERLRYMSGLCLGEKATLALAEGAATMEALARSPFDISPCHECGEPVICLPEGLAMCVDCAKTVAT